MCGSPGDTPPRQEVGCRAQEGRNDRAEFRCSLEHPFYSGIDQTAGRAAARPEWPILSMRNMKQTQSRAQTAPGAQIGAPQKCRRFGLGVLVQSRHGCLCWPAPEFRCVCMWHFGQAPLHTKATHRVPRTTDASLGTGGPPNFQSRPSPLQPDSERTCTYWDAQFL